MSGSADEFHRARKHFFQVTEILGMDRDSANYCITIAKRLRKVYTESSRVEEQEEEALEKLNGMLSRMKAPWTYVVGGMNEGDTTPLYVMQWPGDPIAVPIPPEDSAAATDSSGHAMTFSNAQLEEFAKHLMRRAYLRHVLVVHDEIIFEQNASQSYLNANESQSYIDASDPKVQATISALVSIARRAGWSDSIIRSAEFTEFTAAMLEYEDAKQNARGAEAEAAEAKGRRLHDRLETRAKMAERYRADCSRYRKD